jgi:hypothetical protein
MRTVHYLCRLPGTYGKLVYPLETEEHYQTIGSFFISGADVDDLEDSYTFAAYQAGDIVALKLQRLSGIAYTAEVEGVGQFIFDAKDVGVPAKYAGRFPFPDDGNLIRQLISRDKPQLEEAALEKDFVFLGYSPRLDEDEPPPPVEPISPLLTTETTTEGSSTEPQGSISTSNLRGRTRATSSKTAARARIHLRNG